MLSKELREVIVDDTNKVIDELRDAIGDIIFDDLPDSKELSTKLMNASILLANLSQEVGQ